MGKKLFYTSLVFLCIQISLYSQENKTFTNYDYVNLSVGYNYSFGDPNDQNFHLVTLDLNKMRYGGRHGSGFQYGIGTDFGLNTQDFILGPKVNFTTYFGFIVFGTELITYTDFDQWTLRLAPFIGIGGEKLKLTINPHLRLIHKDFEPINRGLVSLVYNFNLNKKEVVR